MAPFSQSNDFRSWWSSKSGLEQKLIVISSVLFLLSFSLMISTIVLSGKVRSARGSGDTTTTTTMATNTTTEEPSSPTEKTEPPPPTTETTTVPPTNTTTDKPNEAESNLTEIVNSTDIATNFTSESEKNVVF